MSWDFTLEPEFEEQLQWVRTFVDERILPVETMDLTFSDFREWARPLREEVKARGLWAVHLSPELGGQGFGQLKLAHLHEILGRSLHAPFVFGNNAPDSGNTELLALGIKQSGLEEQRARWLQPLLDGDMVSAFSMTEPGAGSDPRRLESRAVRDGGEWIINGHKWFTTHGSVADFLLVMVVTNADVHPYKGMSILIVPADTPGVELVGDIPTMEHPHLRVEPEFWSHSEIRYNDVRIPANNIVGKEGEGFRLAQERLGPGRIHHSMRWLGQMQRAFDMLCERAVTRKAHGSLLAEKQSVQNWIADSRAEIAAARLMTMHAAWRIDQVGASAARDEIAMVQYFASNVLLKVIDRAIQVHGSLGYSSHMPLELMYRQARAARILDGPDEVHRVAVAKSTLKGYAPSDPPSEHVPTRRAAANAPT